VIRWTTPVSRKEFRTPPFLQAGLCPLTSYFHSSYALCVLKMWLAHNYTEYIAPLQEQCHNSKKRSFYVMPTGGMPETISTKWNSVTHLFYKITVRGGKCCSFEVIALPRPVVFPLSWEVVFFKLWQYSSRDATWSDRWRNSAILSLHNCIGEGTVKWTSDVCRTWNRRKVS
jgi:hypothetical protein